MKWINKSTPTNMSASTYSRSQSNNEGVRSFIKYIFIALVGLTGISSANAEEWVDCAGERQFCYVPEETVVRFGANDSYAEGVFTYRVYCSTAAFGGDPAPNVAKRCSYFSETDDNTPLTLSPLNDLYGEVGQSVDLQIEFEAAASTGLVFSASNLPNGIELDSTSGVLSGTLVEQGYFIVEIGLEDQAGNLVSESFEWMVEPPGLWTDCAAENAICDFQGIAEVRYGAGVDYAVQQHVDGVICNNQTFGDPAPEQVKRCAFRTVTSPITLASLSNREDYIGRTVSVQFTAESEAGGVSFSVSGLPEGLTADENGLVTGQLQTLGSYSVQVSVTNNSGGADSATFSWSVLELAGSAKALSSSSLFYETRASANDRLWVANPDNDTVSVFDTQSDLKLSEIAVGLAPQNLIGVGDEIWVVNRDSASISIINAASLAVVSEIALPSGSAPYAVVVDTTTNEVFVSLSASGKLVKVDGASRTIAETIDIGVDIRGLAIDGLAENLYVSKFISPPLPGEDSNSPQTQSGTSSFGGEVFVINLNSFSIENKIVLAHSNAMDSRISGRGIPNYVGALAIAPQGDFAWVPSKQDNIKRGVARDGQNLNHENTVRAITSKINLSSHQEVLLDRLDLDDASMASAAIIDLTGQFIFVALETSRSIAVVDLISGAVMPRVVVGLAPRSLTLSDNGQTLFVHNFMDRTVTKLDISDLINSNGDISTLDTYSLVNTEKLPSNVLLGKQLFYDATDPRLALEAYLSCASCHNDGGNDGRVWDFTGFGEGLRNTIDLVGRGGVQHGPLHWTANFDEVQDFEGQIRKLSAGLGLMSDTHFLSGTRNQPLGDSKAGFSADLDALAAYVSSLDDFPASPFKPSAGFSQEGLTGRDYFIEKGCASCHSGSAFTDSSQLLRHDVGTIHALSGSRIGEVLDGLDTPTLRGLWATGPYLHDGSALSIANAIMAHSSVVVSNQEAAAIEAYLLELDESEAVAPVGGDWELCASEGAICSFDGAKEVRYGANGVYAYTVAENSVPCSNSVFGDPISDVVKACYFRTGGNSIPMVGVISSQVSNLNDEVYFAIPASDPDGDTLVYTAQGLPEGLVLDEVSGEITGVATAVGTYSIDLQVTDDAGGVISRSFVWTILDPASASEWVYCADEGQTCQFSGEAEVRFGKDGIYNTGTYLNSVACTRQKFGDPLPGVFKTCEYKFSNNSKPVVSPIADREENPGVNVEFAVSAVDGDGDILTFSATGLPPGILIDSETGVISGQLVEEGIFTVDVSVTDQVGDTTTVEFNWFVSVEVDPNSSWVHCADELQVCQFSGVREVRFGAQGVYNYGTFDGQVACNRNRFGDPIPNVAKKCFYQSNGNNYPVIGSIEDQLNALGESASLVIDAFDPDGDETVLQVNGLPPGITFDSTANLISGTFALDGDYFVQITASDDKGGESSETFYWSVLSEPGVVSWESCALEGELCEFSGVREVRYGANGNWSRKVVDSSVLCSNTVFGDPISGVAKLCEYRIAGNNPPYAENPGVQFNVLGSSISFSVTAYDPEGGVVSYNATGLPPGVALDQSGLVSGSVDVAGNYDVQIIVTDEPGAPSVLTFSWQVVGDDIESSPAWVPCALEGQVCSFDGERRVRFGSDGNYITRYYIDSVTCSKYIFGDPAPDAMKMCAYQVEVIPDGWTKCADEGERCFFEGTKLVRYGANGAFDYRVAKHSVSCSLNDFHDPIEGSTKHCQVQDLAGDYNSYPAAVESDEWVFCAPHGRPCHFPGTAQVRFGLGDDQVVRTATGMIMCNETAFEADPVPSSYKQEQCEVKLDRSVAGEWSHIQAWPLIPVHASLLPDGLVLAHNATSDDIWPGYTEVTYWDPVAHTFSMVDANQSTYAGQSSEMFCTGFDLMPDGSMLTTGSEPNVTFDHDRNANRIDFQSQRVTRVADNKYFRYYPSMTTTAEGDMVSFAGTRSVAPLEVFKFDGSWDVLSNTSNTFLNSFTYYAWGQTAPNGQLFYPGPAPEMRYFDLTGEGEEINLGARDSLDRDYGSYALYDIGKMFITGGAKPATNSTVLIDINGPSPVVSQGPPMALARRHANLTILADGTLLETGGHTGTTHQDFEPDKAVYSAELWDPTSGQWSVLASMKVNRLYHSTALLLPDGRVMSGGTGYPHTIVENEPNVEIFSPPYLFDSEGDLAVRPAIVEAPDSVGYDHKFIVHVDAGQSITKAHLIKLGAVTHHQNFGQRLVPLDFEQFGSELELTSPSSGNVAPPGYYMLFVVDGNGVPSVAKFIRVLSHPTVSIESGNVGLALGASESVSDSSLKTVSPNGGLAQMWAIVPSASGYFKFISRLNGYALTNSSGQLVLIGDNNSQSQEWELVESSGGYYNVVSRIDSAILKLDAQAVLSLDYSGNSTMQSVLWNVLPYGDINLAVQESGEVLEAGNGQSVTTSGVAGLIQHAWYLEKASNGYVAIRSRKSGDALSMTGSSGVQRSSYTGTNTQLWQFLVNNDGSFRIESLANGYPLRLSDDGNGLVVDQAIMNPVSSENWRAVAAVSGQPTNTSVGGGQLLYRGFVQGKGWKPWVTHGLTAGEDNLSSTINSIEVSTSGVRDGLGIEYEVYDVAGGWMKGQNGSTAGNKNAVLHALRARLKGDSAGCTLKYQVSLDGQGWLPIATEGQVTGVEEGANPIDGMKFFLSCPTVEGGAGESSAFLTVTEGNPDINISAFEGNAYKLRNTSKGGQNIVRVEIDISTAILPDLLFDPLGGAGDLAPACFSSFSGESETGLMPMDPCLTPFEVYRDGGFEKMILEFSDFNPGENIEFGADVDPTSIKGATNEGKSGSISGLELSGSTVIIEFDDGTVLTSKLFSDGSKGGAQSCLSANQLGAPTLSIPTLTGAPLVTDQKNHVLHIFSQPNSTIEVSVLEAGLFGENGFDIDEFEANSLIKANHYSVITDASGSANLDISLTHTALTDLVGYHLIQAAIQQPPEGCTGHMSSLEVFKYSP